MPNHAFPAAAEGMPKLNRRSILGGILPATAAFAVPLAVPAAASPANPADAWAAFIATLGERLLPDGRVLVYGTQETVRAAILCTVMEPISPKIDKLVPVERCVGSYRMSAAGWQDEDILS